ncbi:DEAD/DEAH box helicase [Streptococcus suis]|uniref:Superfamily II DNA/RNA helicase n=1 Tax=Streptococcus suis TaxID=1307 RepID=A0A123VGJ0_STRSU|nr:DEAD/DEAH box helicase [Streptococcus suis]NQH51306.1 DEAD/DEAH box helicase [Streptococcus suis]NQP66699.1 DEAD/DEAH box helicase [Streptococcus suis]NQR91873.1 DEAD/DEAH box helicase [Streptococcus suis]CYU60604.1 superfamily II DNA/RNA helicase [Streptococcus suis]CYX47070.1 superfamily II DNA/RNA helicase [Streptococcus suis]
MKSKFPSSWTDQLTLLGFEDFTPIQVQAFEPIANGKSLLAISPTGTGKTLAYLWPSLLALTPKKAQQLLILAPNTELAGQIFEVCKTWSETIGLTAQLFLSGSSQKRQIERLKKGPEILIGTPGRIFELIKLKKIKMMNINTIVLDEFDQLFSDSQYQFVEKIINYVPRDHQLIYMSATAKFDRQKIAEDIESINLSEQKLDNIQHCYMMVDKRDRLETLRKFANIPDFRALAFFNNLSDLGASEDKLLYNGVNAVSLASDVNVKFRKVIIERFKNRELNLLLATDMVARGIDIDNLECVLNFEVPFDQEAYTHRSGRTGRMGKEGLVITLVSSPSELKQLKKYASVQEVILKNQALYKI